MIERLARAARSVEADDAAAAQAAAQALLATGHLTNLQRHRARAAARRRRAAPRSRRCTGRSPAPRGSADRDLLDERVGATAASSPSPRHRRGLRRPARGRPAASAARSRCRAGRCRRRDADRARRPPTSTPRSPPAPTPSGDAARLPAAARSPRQQPLCGRERRGHARQHAQPRRQADLRRRGGPRTLAQVRRVQRNRRAARGRRRSATRPPPRRPSKRCSTSTSCACACSAGAAAALRRRRPVRARARDARRCACTAARSAARALDPGRRRLPAPDQAARRAARADVHAGRTPRARQEQPRPRHPGTVPAQRLLHLPRRTFRVFTLHASAFPSGPLTIRVLIPIPYTLSRPALERRAQAGASDSRLAPSACSSSSKDVREFLHALALERVGDVVVVDAGRARARSNTRSASLESARSRGSGSPWSW